MPESPTVVPPAPIAALQDDLVATKVTPPRVRPSLLARPALVSRFEDAIAHELTLVCTPPGFGKTTLIAAWAATTDRAVAWLSLDDDDNDPARFWRYVVAALSRVWPGIGARALAMLGGPGREPGPEVVTALINDVAARDDEIVLILDDAHAIVSRSVQEELAFLVDHLPACLNLVIAGRSDPPLPLAELRARGQLAELRAADLRFSPAEAAAFLGDLWGLALPAEAVAALAERTEGWVAGLQLAALSLRHQPDPAAFVVAFAGSHRFVLDYLSEEVLARQPEEMRAFLLSTAVLERLSGPLCDAVTGRDDGQEMLEAAERANLFVVPLDEHRHWYRYHHLFSDLLRVHLGQECPAEIADLHRRAAAWYQENGLTGDAIHHALAAGDAEHAVRMIEATVEELIWWRSEGVTLERWLAALPNEALRTRPRLALARALRALVACRMEEASTLVDRVEQAPSELLDEPFVPTIGRERSELVNVPAASAFIRAVLASRRGDPADADTYARRTLRLAMPDDRQLRAVARALPAEASWLAGLLDEAETLLEAAIAEPEVVEEPYLATRALFDLGQVQLARGQPREAEKTYRRALAMLDATGLAPLPAASLQHVGLAEVLRQRDDLDAALHHATVGLELCRLIASTEPSAFGLATLAWIHYARGDHARAQEAIDEAARVVPSPNVVALFNPAPAERARLLLAVGEIDRVVRWAAERGLSEDDEPSYARERDYLVLARLLLARGVPRRALPLLGRLQKTAEAEGRLGSLVEIQALQALAMDAASDPTGALDVLIEALRLAQREGYVRLFVDEGAPMTALLRRLVASAQRGHLPSLSGVLVDFAVRLLGAAPTDQSETATNAVRIAGSTIMVDPLTERESEVLVLLAEGRPNREIADRLVVTLDTVKKHLTHIFGKLGAASRTQAVARARELGLIG